MNVVKCWKYDLKTQSSPKVCNSNKVYKHTIYTVAKDFDSFWRVSTRKTKHYCSCTLPCSPTVHRMTPRVLSDQYVFIIKTWPIRNTCGLVFRPENSNVSVRKMYLRLSYSIILWKKKNHMTYRVSRITYYIRY